MKPHHSAGALALGFRVHTGWSAVVAAGGAFPQVTVPHRGGVELLDADSGISRFVYHDARELSLAKAAELVHRAREAVHDAASGAVKLLMKTLRAAGHDVTVAAILAGGARVPDDLAAILASHALVHAAEGALFRQALVSAAEACGLEVIIIPERQLWQRAAAAFGEDIRQQVAARGKSLGPPWAEDQRAATVAALLALRRD